MIKIIKNIFEIKQKQQKLKKLNLDIEINKAELYLFSNKYNSINKKNSSINKSSFFTFNAMDAKFEYPLQMFGLKLNEIFDDYKQNTRGERSLLGITAFKQLIEDFGFETKTVRFNDKLERNILVTGDKNFDKFALKFIRANDIKYNDMSHNSVRYRKDKINELVKDNKELLKNVNPKLLDSLEE